MILVTGATGTIGRPLVNILVNEGAEVRAVIRGTGPASLLEGVKGGGRRPVLPKRSPPCWRALPPCSCTPAPSGSPQAACWHWPGNGGCSGWQRCRRLTSTIPWTSSRPASEGTSTGRLRTPPPAISRSYLGKLLLDRGSPPPSPWLWTLAR